MIFIVIIAVVSLTHGVTIHCTFQNIGWTTLGAHYTCYPAILFYDGNLTHVIDVYGSHASGKTNVDVKGFWIQTSYQYLNRIPKGIEKFFQNLIGFSWNYENLPTLTADDFESFNDLEWLSVHSNDLVSLDGDLFKHTPKLRLISFSNNLIEHVGYGLLDGLSNLTEAYFYNNSCISMNAVTSAAVQELKLGLQTHCSPLEITTSSSTSIPLTPTTTSSTSTEPGQCSAECVELIDILVERQEILDARQDYYIGRLLEACMIPAVFKEEINKQTDKIALENKRKTSQYEMLAELREEIVRLRTKIKSQDEMIAAQSDATQEIEKKMKEIWARS